MKRFVDYLADSKKTYDFKIKIAGETDNNTKDNISSSLTQFDPVSCKRAIRTPIQETHADFPTHKNISVTVFDVCLNYPATSEQVRAHVAECLGLSHACVVVRSLCEESESDLNHQHDSIDKQSILLKPYEIESNQDLVGEKRKMELLKELSRAKHAGEKYTGVNDQLLTPSEPVEKERTQRDVSQQTSPIGSNLTKLPKAKTFSGL